MQDWTERYRPKTLDDIVGNEYAIMELRKWANTWAASIVPKKRAAILSGKPGIGKTSSALALANDFGWTPIELNASDARNAVTIKKVATSGAINETFDNHGRFIPRKTGGRKLIILDEADNLYEKSDSADKNNDLSDRGGKKAIIDTIRITKHPVILIVNDYYSLIKGGGESLKEMCLLIRYHPVYPNAIIELLKRICREEGITVDHRTLLALAERCKGDVRSAINDLQSICLNKKQIDIQSLDAIGYRDREKIIFDALRDIFKTKNIQSIRESISNLDEPPDRFLLWLDENLPREYIDVEDLLKGYEALSKADIFLGRTHKRQYYGLWPYASDMMTSGVATAKKHGYNNDTYNFPSWLIGMKNYKTTRSLRDSIIKKISLICHNSNKKSREFIFTYFRQLFRNNAEFAAKMKNRMDLTENEIKYILGEKYNYKLKDILHFFEKNPEKQIDIDIVLSDKDKKDKREEVKQPSLFDF